MAPGRLEGEWFDEESETRIHSARPKDVRFKDKTLLPGEGHDWLAHSSAVLTLVVYGRLDEGFAEGTQRCGPWEVHVKPRGAEHTTATGPEGVRMLLVRLPDAAVERLGPPAPEEPRVIRSGVHVARALAVFERLAGGETGARSTSALASLWRQLCPWARREGPRRPAWIRRVHRHVRSEGDERTSLADLARDCEVHPVYLARAFRRHYARSIGDARRRGRMNRAVARLTAGEERLTDLALDLGYADQSHFTREFKRETGWTPSRFRRVTADLARLAPRLGR